MTKPQFRPYSRYSTEALGLLAQLIRAGRISKRISGQEMASRVGISRSLLQRIEKGEPNCAIGAVLEAAAIAGVSLFDADQKRLQVNRALTGEVLSLLPKAARRTKRLVKDDF